MVNILKRVILFLLFGICLVYAKVDYTSTSRTECINSKCTLETYLSTKFVYEDNIWKTIDKAKSLKNTDIKCNIKKQFSDDPNVNCDFNLFNISLQNITYKNNNVPFSIINKSNNIVLLGGIIRLNQNRNYNYKIPANMNLDDIEIHLGSNSTKIQINVTLSTDTGYLYGGCGGCASSESNTDMLVGVSSTGSGYGWKGFVSFNTSIIPDDAIIDSANLFMYLTSETWEGDETSNANVYYSNYGTLTTADFCPNTGALQSAIVNDDSLINTWYNIAITTSTINVTGTSNYMINASTACADTDDLWDFYTAGIGFPQLNVTYTEGAPPSDTCTYSGSGVWSIDADDYCIIQNQNINNNIQCVGTGFLTILNNVQFNSLLINPNCKVNKYTS